MKKHLLTTLCSILIFIPLKLKAQDTLNLDYFKKLKDSLLMDNNVKETKLSQKTLFNGEFYLQEFYVKYKDDPLNRYWRIGKDFGYDVMNKKLVSTSKVDIMNKTLTDTAFWYNENGEVKKMVIYKNTSKKIAFRNKYNFFSIFQKYFVYFPEQFIKIEFCNGQKQFEFNYRFFESKGFLLDGTVIYYKADGTIDKVVKYSMGKEVTAP